MSLFDFIKGVFQNEASTDSAPEDYCPNCWGRQEYNGQFYEAIDNNHIDLNNINEKKGWIQAYAATHLEGIKLKDHEEFKSCPSCKITYTNKGE